MTVSPTTVPVASVVLRWLGPGEGGRTSPPTGSVYAATAYFADDTVGQSFSIVLEAPSSEPFLGGGPQRVSLRLLAPERLPEVVRRLEAGRQVVVTEGRRVVAVGRLESIHQEAPVAPFAPATA